MKYLFFVIAPFALLFASCSESESDDCVPESQYSRLVCNAETEKLYRGNGKIYMRNFSSSYEKSLETMLEVGIMKKGKVTLNLPENVDTLFLEKLESTLPTGVYIEPKDAEIWFYESLLMLMDDNGNYIGNLWYEEVNEHGYAPKIDGGSEMHYWYFSEDAKINISPEISEEEIYLCGYNINAKKGWNKVHHLASGVIIVNIIPFFLNHCYTTNLDEDDYFMWIIDLY